MFRLKFEESGLTRKWEKEYDKLNKKDKELLIKIISNTQTEMKKIAWPKQLQKIMPYYFITKKDLDKKKVEEVELFN